MKFLSQLKNIQGKTVLLRADLDAPSENGRILDDFRILSAVPSIEYILKQGAKLIIISKNGHKTNESLELVGKKLEQLLNRRVLLFKEDIREERNIIRVKADATENIVLLENIRNYEEEENGDLNFAKKLASLGDIFVSDAFAMMHRNEVSVAVLPTLMPSYAGLTVEKEISGLDKVLNLKAKPFVVIIGGAKVSDKVGVIRNLGRNADQILIGGGPANLFMAAKGYEMGQSLYERDLIPLAEELLRNFKQKIILPTDFVVADPNDLTKVRVAKVNDIKPNEAAYDIGPETILEFSKYIKVAKKMAWNGPMGLFEKAAFSHGTKSLALIYASRAKGQAYAMVGGGDTLEALDQAKVADSIDFVSTAGGASLKYLAGEELPGLKALGE